MRDVVITGMGTVSALGNTLPEASERAWRGEARFTRCDDALWGEAGAALRCRVAARVQGFDTREHVSPRIADWHDPATAFALAAAREAIGQAQLEADPSRVGVLIGQAAPGNTLTHRGFQAAFSGKAHELPGRLLPLLSGHIATSLLALERGYTGPTFGVINACASGATTLALAADLIRLGRADVVIAGAADAPIGLNIFGSMLNARAMNPTDDPHRPCRPFAADRAGLIVGEGAGAVVLESAAHAQARGATVLGRMLGEAMSNDAFHLYGPDPSGARWAQPMRLALQAAGVSPDEVDVVNAHAAGTPLGDATEVTALRLALGARAEQVPVSSTKSMLGHTFGAAGALETILALQALNQGRVLPTAGLTEPGADCDLDHVPDAGRCSAGRILLKNAFGFGGTNTCLVIEAAG